MSITMFVVGFFIFAFYLVGLVTMITKAHKQQRKELMNDPELSGFDWEAYDRGEEQTFTKRELLSTVPKKRKRTKRNKTKTKNKV